MDELQLVRDFFGEQPPPDPAMAAAAKARLSAAGPPAARRRAGRRRPLVRWGVPAVAAAVAATVVAAVAVQGPAVRKPVLPGQPSQPAQPRQGSGLGVFRVPPGAAVGALAGSGREVLLMAARTVADAPQPRSARYYVTPGIVGNFVRLGPSSDRYTVLEAVNRQFWAARNPRDGSPDMSQALYVQAASPADEAAWRRDGSPRVWKDVGQDADLADPVGLSLGWQRPLSAARGKLTALSAVYGAQQFDVGDKTLTLRQLEALPADPARLKSLLLAGMFPGSSVSATSFLFQTVPAVLEMPVTPAVRAALYRVLAGLPGVSSLGAVADVSGRRGVAVAYTARYSGCGREARLGEPLADSPAEFSSCSVQQILIIGPGDGMPLASEVRYASLPPGARWSVPDGLFSYEVYGTPYWTNSDRPR